VTKRSRKLLCLLGLAGLGLSACSGTNPTTTAGSNASSVRHTYVALGESGSNGSRTRFDLRTLWPQIFYESTIGTNGTFFDFTNPDDTIANEIHQVLPYALAVHPNLVTVWTSAGDLTATTPAPTYERELSQLVNAFRRRGAIVLLANVAPPALDGAIGACSGNASGCQPSSHLSVSAVSAYDSAIAAVARATGSRLVNLHGILTAAIHTEGLAGVLAPDQSSLSPTGAALVARAFRAQLPKGFLRGPRS
jgi:hypothetical protein